MNGARLLIESLLRENVDTLFCYIGGQVIPIFDELHRYREHIRLIHPRHEQAGTHAADGYARAGGKPGVVLVTSGPGATNTVTGIANAFMDSIPLVVLTGQVPTHKIGSDAFQEADIIGMTMPVTKGSFAVRRSEEIPAVVRRAFHLAVSGRPGPVLIDIPSDLQWQEVAGGPLRPRRTPPSAPRPAARQVRRAIELLRSARKPVVLAGGGVIFSDSAPAVDAFLDHFDLPAAVTLMGHGLAPAKEELLLGGIGMHGSQFGNYALQHADLIVALGTRFSDRILGDPFRFAPQAAIVQVDIDPAELGKNRDVTLAIHGSVREVVDEWRRLAPDGGRHPEWLAELAAFRRAHPLHYERRDDRLQPQWVVETLSRVFPAATIVASDVGQNQMWVSQYYRFRHPRTYIGSGGLGTMGFALPAAIGAALARPDRPVLAVAGDGGFQMNIQELATLRQYELAVKMAVLDNGCLGMVRQWQELLCHKRYCGSFLGPSPDFAAVARAYGIPAVTVSTPDAARAALEELARCTGPMLVHARVAGEENVLPMIPPGRSFADTLTRIS